MPRWPGPLLIVLGALVAVGALSAAQMAGDGQIEADPSSLGPIALVGALMLTGGLVYSAIRQIRIRSVLRPDRYRGPSVVVLLALALVVASLAVVPFGSDVAVLLGADREISLLGAVVILVSTPLALLLVTWLFVWRPRALDALPSLPGRDPQGALLSGFGWGVLAWLGSTLVIVGVGWLLERVGMPPDPSAAELAIERLDPWLVTLAVVVLAPIAEEIFFRGVVFNAWLREGGRRYAYIGSAALFAIIHLSLVSLVPIFLLGLALAWVYERTGSLLAPMAMHATVNGISVALALLVRFDVVQLPV